MFTVNYPKENVFSPIIKVLKGGFPEERIAAGRPKCLLSSFCYECGLLSFGKHMRTSTKKIKKLLHVEHESPLEGEFSLSQSFRGSNSLIRTKTSE